METMTIPTRNSCETAARAAILHAEIANRAATKCAEAAAAAHLVALQEDVDIRKNLGG